MFAAEYASVRSYFHRTLGAQSAEDAACTTFARLAHAYHAGRYPDVGLVANGVRVDTIRAAVCRQEEPAGDAADVLSLVAPPETPERKSFRDSFDRSLRALEDEERDAYILSELRGLSSREAADVLGTSHITVQRRAESARLLVREELAA